MIRLGLRLALADGRRSAFSVALTAAAVAIGTAILLFAISFQPALGDRDSRQAWRQPLPPGDAQPRLLMAGGEDRFAGQPLVRIFLAPLTADAPTPPGLTRLPGPGEAYVSPALADLLARTPADQLAPRIGRVVGTIGPEGLRSPQELVAVIGADPSSLTGKGAEAVTSFRTTSLPPDLPPAAILILVLAVVGALAPVAVFVATATRMAAARREQRLAALRLIGATPAQVSRLAIVEALLYTAIGAPAGVALFFLARPAVALIPLDGSTWWPDAMVPPIAQALLLLVLVQIVGAAAALFGMRRLSVSPLGVQQRVTPPAPTAWRIVPMLAGTVVLLGSIVVLRGNSMATPEPLIVLGGSFAAIIGGIAFAGPWLTAVVGRVLGRVARGPAALLAARRLADDPRGSFGAIAGVIMAVFVASAFFSFAAYATLASGRWTAPLRPGEVQANLTSESSSQAVTSKLASVPGVVSVLPVRPILLGDIAKVAYLAWVVPCDKLLAAVDLPGAVCGGSLIHTSSPGGLPDATYPVVTFDATGNPIMPPAGQPQTQLRADSTTVSPLVPGSSDQPLGFPQLIVDPSALGAAAADLPFTQLYVTTDGTAAAGERVRAAVQGIDPWARVLLSNDPVDAIPQFAEVARIVGLGLIGSLALAGCSLAVATITGLLQRRRQFVLLRAAGMPISRLRALVLLQTGVPLVVVSTVSAVLGVGVAQGVLRISNVPSVPLPDFSLVAVLVASLAVAMGVVTATLPAVDRLTRPQSLRSE
jgi:cell division protein FtsX